jgi:oligoribonuclease NrnB/cAMP/cGMP phosphodiesterase (DHH superfamily)
VEKIKDFDSIIYHGPCPDGTGGLWAACHYKPIKNRYACKAGLNPKGNYTNMNIIFVDLCPQIDYLLELVKIAKYVVILDHHKSSENRIKNNKLLLSKIKNLHIEFDMNRSGCQMAWDYFFDSKPRPFFIDYMGDIDLWKFNLDHSKEINAALTELEYIDSYDLSKLTQLLNSVEEKIDYLKNAGKIILISYEKQIKIAVSNAIEGKIFIGDKLYRIWLGGNINPGLRSYLGNALCEKPFKDGTMPDFSATWMYDPKSDEWWIGLRGIQERSPDLSELASYYGGGGHSEASGFIISSSPKLLKEIFIY